MKTLLLCLATVASLHAQTIEEKKESFHKLQTGLDQVTEEQLALVNESLQEKRFVLTSLYEKGEQLYKNGADKESYRVLSEEISLLKSEIAHIEEMWRKEMSSSESYALWYQPETTLSNLIIEYGAQDYIYLIPPSIGGMALSINSSLPLPRESWGECLELILKFNGIGVRELNPYLRELYLLQNDCSEIKHITSQREDLDILPSHERICFILSSDSADPAGTLNFLKKFSNPSTTSLELIRGEIFILSNPESIKELLKLHEFVKSGNRSQDYQLVSFTKVDAKEMQSILESAFPGCVNTGDSLRVLPLTCMNGSLFLFGTKEEVARSVKLMRDVESQVEDTKAKTLFWYTVKHSDPEELASVLAKVYDLLTSTSSPTNGKEGEGKKSPPEKIEKVAEGPKNPPNLAIKPALIAPTSQERKSHRTSDGQNNFIVDQKSGSIIMVVEQEALPKIKDLLRKLDVPKKMVKLEVLLFEKKITNQNKSGLNLLRLGSKVASEALSNATNVSWNAKAQGILEFLISRKESKHLPAFDLAYHFLLGQEDVQINASPSITTMNQTPATIAIVEEISINTGMDTEEEKKSRNSYSRAQYGITIQITPTINCGEVQECESEGSFITLDTDITFDTTNKNQNERPDVTRRHIKNHVRIADGETLILGGLRRKNSQDNKESLPFLGEIPGVGKLFSTTDLYDSSTEMFVFITPKIISDALEDEGKLKKEELKKRPGDLPEFLHELTNAKNREKKRLFEGSLTALFGRQDSNKNSSAFKKQQGEYDGR